jgi:RNA recognition motif-containing protein
MDILELNKITVTTQKIKASQKQSSEMKMSKVGNQTNSQDPQAVNSRVFVGNLNTFQCSKTDVERMFQRYGRLAGISMHKGYAFVQFTNPFDARSACLGEDGRTVLSQILDVNMVAEPKPHQTGRKRQNVAKTGNDWDYYYDSYYA